ncbi:hypothetical protein [Stenotrophomonas sp.]|uniref:hypothetical protein n=1 Tax=Stenotrophomonas sp. TaxID=69392 RepID=UPI002FCAAE82
MTPRTPRLASPHRHPLTGRRTGQVHAARRYARALLMAAALVALAGCSSDGDVYANLPGDNPGAQCVMSCQQQRSSCLARSDTDRRTGCDVEAARQCDRIDNDDLRRSCLSQAQACMDQSPLISCSQESDRCMSSCGGS